MCHNGFQALASTVAGPDRLLELARPDSWPTPEHATATETTRYGTAVASAWGRMHPRLTRRGAWLDHPDDQELPIVEGTLIRLQVDQAWQAFLRRFDLEHTFRFFQQQLGWTVPKLRDPAAADRWTWLIIVVHTQLRLARGLTGDLRRPWERPCPPERLALVPGTLLAGQPVYPPIELRMIEKPSLPSTTFVGCVSSWLLARPCGASAGHRRGVLPHRQAPRGRG